MNDSWRALAITLLTALLFVCPPATSGESEAPDPATTQRRARAQRRPRTDYTRFSHRTQAHKLNCAQCHAVPTANWPRARAADAFPDVTDYPGHDACVRCHREQFFRGARPAICTVCHTVVSPREGPRFAFQNPNADESRAARRKPGAPSQFATNFPHDIHQDVMARRRDFPDGGDAGMVRVSFQEGASPRRVDSCTLCHQTYMPQGESADESMPGRPAEVDESLWPKKGTFKTSPTGHASCFNCHWKDGGARPLATDCAACHDLLPGDVPPPKPRVDHDASLAAVAKIADDRIREKLLRRESARFRHELERHEGLGCTSCHLQMSSVRTLDERTLKVPILSCGGTGTGCHIGAKPKRILNDEVERRRADAGFACAKCHVQLGRARLPPSHDEAVPVPKPR
ncbi:MAG TPA: hypothetical protein VER32_10565 [Pyrinomonadaceae bacterium]|nr:hypothetical protein [Pyrinomonadaceae bacterium]